MTGVQYYYAAARDKGRCAADVIRVVRRIAVLCITGFLLSVSGVFAQESNTRPDAAYLIPQTVFVGDGGRLVFPLGSAFSGVKGEVLDDPDLLPKARDIVISRVELENSKSARTGKPDTPRLLVDFTAYTPGFIELPPIKIAGFTFTGLEVGIASILEAEGNSRVLSPPAPPLAVPGTMGMIYGTVFGIIVLILGSLFFGTRGLPMLRRYGKRQRRRRMIRSIGKLLKQLRGAVSGTNVPGTEETAAALDRLNGELRLFLESLTGEACRTMVPEEFLTLPPLDGPGSEGSEARSPDSLGAQYGGAFFCDVFLRCDAMRFSGRPPERGELAALLDAVQGFVERAAGL
ncbi:hypothetical protein FACS1894130_05960 [Spirochaetia bacterium]|nr:hypothetical protein FACS1894130_05960 [Spirochaetia bacterium]